MNSYGRPEDVVRAELRRALQARDPDRTAMLNRIAANRAAGPRPPGWRRRETLRLAGSALAVLAVVGIAGGARWAIADDDRPSLPAAPAVNAPAATAPSSPTASAAVGQPATGGPASTKPHTSAPASQPPATSSSATVVRGHPGDTEVEKGSLWSDGSIDADGENTVTLKPGVALTELDLTIRVTLTAGLTDEGATDDVQGVQIDTRVEHAADALLYHFVLKAGETLPAGTYVFTAHYRHNGDTRDTSDDTYEAFSFTVDRKHPHVYGNFLPSD